MTDALCSPDSPLRIDQAETQKSGEIHITINSLDEWCKRSHGFSVKGESATRQNLVPRSGAADNQRSVSPDDLRPESDGKYEGLAATFAFLLDAFVEKVGKSVSHEDGRPNVSAIARRLEEIAKKANKGDPIRGQGEETIKGRIEDAITPKRLIHHCCEILLIKVARCFSIPSLQL